jgi:hypothetical protein
MAINNINNKNIILRIVFSLIFILFLSAPRAFVFAQNQNLIYYNDPQVLVCKVLRDLGIGCTNSAPIYNNYNSSNNPNNNNNNYNSSGNTNNTLVGNSGQISGQQPGQIINSSQSQTNVTSNNSNFSGQQGVNNNFLQASITNTLVKRKISNDEVILVKTQANGVSLRPTIGLKSNEAIFEIIKGQRHFIPTIDIFFDYGFDLSSVQDISIYDLYKFPRTKLVKVQGNSKEVYYITEGNMIRLCLNEEILKSYGDRQEDIITISKKEFSFYPRNQYIFLENPLSRDIFQISIDGVKRYVVPQVVQRLRIRSDQVAPVNKQEFDSYKYGPPIIF